MKFVWMGTGILALFLALGIWSAVSMDDTHKQIAETLDQAAQSALADDMEAGIAAYREAKASWQKHWRVTASITDHGPMDEIDSLFSEVDVYALTEEMPHFAASCTQLAELVRAVGDAQRLTWWNFL